MLIDIHDMGLERMSYPHLTGVPVQLPSTEALADANTFVCEFNGSGATETGAGLGLAGTDQVFTLVGSPSAAVGGYRAFNGSSQYATATAAFAAAFLNQDEWTYALKFKSFTVATSKLFWNFAQTSSMYAQTASAAGRLLGGIGDFFFLNATTNIPSTSSPIWLCAWRKNGNFHIGWVQQEDLPTGWDSFPSGQRDVVVGASAMSGTWTTINPVGATGNMAALSVGVVVASKIGLAAAPS